jgi:hypothetical protein
MFKTALSEASSLRRTAAVTARNAAVTYAIEKKERGRAEAD